MFLADAENLHFHKKTIKITWNNFLSIEIANMGFYLSIDLKHFSKALKMNKE